MIVVRIKGDENLPIEVARKFNAAGHDALSVLDQKMGGASDKAIAGLCRDEGRILITLDGGFSDIRSYPTKENPGFIVFRLRRMDKAYVLNMVERVVEALGGEEINGRLWIVDESRVRIRE